MHAAHHRWYPVFTEPSVLPTVRSSSSGTDARVLSLPVNGRQLHAYSGRYLGNECEGGSTIRPAAFEDVWGSDSRAAVPPPTKTQRRGGTRTSASGLRLRSVKCRSRIARAPGSNPAASNPSPTTATDRVRSFTRPRGLLHTVRPFKNCLDGMGPRRRGVPGGIAHDAARRKQVRNPSSARVTEQSPSPGGGSFQA